MRAGEPPSCVTPDVEAQAQLHGGVIPGSYPVVLDFDHKSEVKVGSWEGILSFHNFELHENADVTAWKASGVGPGKRFTTVELDKKYVRKGVQSPKLQAPQQEMQVPEDESRFAQGSTGATFATVLAVESFAPEQDT